MNSLNQMTTSKLHLEIIDKQRQELFERLAPYTADFYLSGGTALALQLGHRKSFYFDFFSKGPVESNLLEKLSKVCAVRTVSIDTPDDLTFLQKIKLNVLFYSILFLFLLIFWRLKTK